MAHFSLPSSAASQPSSPSSPLSLPPAAWLSPFFVRDLDALKTSLNRSVSEYEGVRKNMERNARALKAQLRERERQLYLLQGDQHAELCSMVQQEEREIADVKMKYDVMAANLRMVHEEARNLIAKVRLKKL
jgi:deoxyribodipyrimidine photolyase